MEQAPSRGSYNCYDSFASLPPQSAPTHCTQATDFRNRYSPSNSTHSKVCPSLPPSETRGKGPIEMSKT